MGLPTIVPLTSRVERDAVAGRRPAGDNSGRGRWVRFVGFDPSASITNMWCGPSFVAREELSTRSVRGEAVLDGCGADDRPRDHQVRAAAPAVKTRRSMCPPIRHDEKLKILRLRLRWRKGLGLRRPGTRSRTG